MVKFDTNEMRFKTTKKEKELKELFEDEKEDNILRIQKKGIYEYKDNDFYGY